MPAPPSSPSTARILVVDDDESNRSLLGTFLAQQGFEILFAGSGPEALQLLGAQPVDMIISDVRMPGMSGLEALHRLRATHPVLPVLLVTAYPDVRGAVDAMRDGALNYLEKPIDLDELVALVREGLGLKEPAGPLRVETFVVPPGVVAASRQMQMILREAALIAPSDSRVLITGDSGTGKEVGADLIHRWSRRAAAPLLKVNCAAIPETLLESELFGYEKGAFTGAAGPRVGRFEEADTGTILLDEIAEMSAGLQAKLLRVIQNGTFQRLGANTERCTRARVLATTNRNLDKEVAEQRFREDLYYRLNVIELYVPPLRERPEDIVPLASLFLAGLGSGRARLAASTAACLSAYAWPGNVRELQNAMERAALLARGEVVLPEHLPQRVQQAAAEASVPAAVASGKRLEEVERMVILQSLREHDNNRSATARALGISRRALLYKISRYAEEGFPVDPA